MNSKIPTHNEGVKAKSNSTTTKSLKSVKTSASTDAPSIKTSLQKDCQYTPSPPLFSKIETENDVMKMAAKYIELQKMKNVKWFVAHGTPHPTPEDIAAVIEKRQETKKKKRKADMVADLQRASVETNNTNSNSNVSSYMGNVPTVPVHLVESLMRGEFHFDEDMSYIPVSESIAAVDVMKCNDRGVIGGGSKQQGEPVRGGSVGNTHNNTKSHAHPPVHQATPKDGGAPSRGKDLSGTLPPHLSVTIQETSPSKDDADTDALLRAFLNNSKIAERVENPIEKQRTPVEVGSSSNKTSLKEKNNNNSAVSTPNKNIKSIPDEYNTMSANKTQLLDISNSSEIPCPTIAAPAANYAAIQALKDKFLSLARITMLRKRFDERLLLASRSTTVMDATQTQQQRGDSPYYNTWYHKNQRCKSDSCSDEKAHLVLLKMESVSPLIGTTSSITSCPPLGGSTGIPQNRNNSGYFPATHTSCDVLSHETTNSTSTNESLGDLKTPVCDSRSNKNIKFDPNMNYMYNESLTSVDATACVNTEVYRYKEKPMYEPFEFKLKSYYTIQHLPRYHDAGNIYCNDQLHSNDKKGRPSSPLATSLCSTSIYSRVSSNDNKFAFLDSIAASRLSFYNSIPANHHLNADPSIKIKDIAYPLVSSRNKRNNISSDLPTKENKGTPEANLAGVGEKPYTEEIHSAVPPIEHFVQPLITFETYPFHLGQNTCITHHNSSFAQQLCAAHPHPLPAPFSNLSLGGRRVNPNSNTMSCSGATITQEAASFGFYKLYSSMNAVSLVSLPMVTDSSSSSRTDPSSSLFAGSEIRSAVALGRPYVLGHTVMAHKVPHQKQVKRASKSDNCTQMSKHTVTHCVALTNLTNIEVSNSSTTPFATAIRNILTMTSTKEDTNYRTEGKTPTHLDSFTNNNNNSIYSTSCHHLNTFSIPCKMRSIDLRDNLSDSDDDHDDQGLNSSKNKDLLTSCMKETPNIGDQLRKLLPGPSDSPCLMLP